MTQSCRKFLKLCLVHGVVGASILVLCFPAKAEPELVDRNYDLRRLSVQVYSKAFAKRFELPVANVIDQMPKELHALELVAERHEWSDPIYCNLKAYFDSALPVYLPEGPLAGSLAMKKEGGHFFNAPRRNEQGSWIGWSEADRIALSLGERPYNRAARLATRDYKLPVGNVFIGASQGMRILEYHKELLPAVGYMKLGSDCALLARTGRYPAGWNLWIKREGGADYGRILHEKPEDFFIWPIPEALLERFRPAAVRIAKYRWRGDSPNDQFMRDLIGSK